MSLTRIGSIGINTGIAFAGVTTIVTLNTANDALSIGATVNVGSGITLGASGDIFATGVSTFSGNLKVGSGVTISPDGDGFYTGVVTATTFSGALAASNLTGTIADARFPATLPAVSGANLTNLDASDLASGTVPTARLGSGTASSSTFLRGDSTFAAVTSTTINSNTNNYLITGTGTADTLQGEANLTFDGDDLLIRSSTDGRRISFATDGTSHYMKYDDTLSGIILNGYGGIAFETNGTNERLRIDSGGRVVIGHTSNIGIANHNGRFQLHGTDYDTATMSIVHNGTDSFGPFLFFASQRSGSPGGSTVLQNNDAVGTIRFHAGDGTDMASYCAAIQVKIDGTPGSNDVPGRIMFSTTADGAAAPTERMRITSEGRMGLKTTSPDATLHIGGIIDSHPVMILEGGTSSTGDLTVPHTENLQVGHWNSSSNTYTNRFQISGGTGSDAGSITMPTQPCMVFTNVADVTPSNNTPLSFSGLDVSKGGMSESNSRSRITVPTNGTYLVSALCSGACTTAAAGDGIQFFLRKNGSTFPGDTTFPAESYGSEVGMEFAFTFCLAVNLSANDYLEVCFANIDSSAGSLASGYFAVSLLH